MEAASAPSSLPRASAGTDAPALDVADTPGIALALGGGAVRGVAHLGVLDVLERERIPVRAVAGTSVGALVAAVYATRPWPGADALAAEIDACSLNPVVQVQLGTDGRASPWRRAWNALRMALRALGHDALFDGRGLDAFLTGLLGDRTFADTRIPLQIAATDLDSGAMVVLRDGPLLPAVRASAAIPGIFPPVEMDRRRLVDGAVSTLVSVGLLRGSAELVVAVDVSDAEIARRPRRAPTIAWQASHISIRHLRDHEVRAADVAICATSPHPVLGFDFTRIDELIAIGRRAAEAALPEIQDALQRAATLRGDRSSRHAAAAGPERIV